MADDVVATQLKYEAVTAQAQAAMRGLTSAIQSNSNKSVQAVNKTAQAWTRWQAGIVTVNQGIQLFNRTVGRFVSSMARAVDLSAQQRTGIRRMGFSFGQMGLDVERATAMIEEFADVTQRTTQFGDDQTRLMAQQFAALASGAVSSIEDIIEGTSLIMDIVELTGKSATRVTRTVAQAYAGEVEALRTLLPGQAALIDQLNEIDDASERAARTLDVLNASFRGGRLQVDEIAQQTAELENVWGDAWEAMGDAISEGLQDGEILENTIEQVERLGDTVERNQANISSAVRLLGDIWQGFLFTVNSVALGLERVYFELQRLEHFTTGVLRRSTVAVAEEAAQSWLDMSGQSTHAISRVTDAQREAWAERRRMEGIALAETVRAAEEAAVRTSEAFSVMLGLGAEGFGEPGVRTVAEILGGTDAERAAAAERSAEELQKIRDRALRAARGRGLRREPEAPEIDPRLEAQVQRAAAAAAEQLEIRVQFNADMNELLQAGVDFEIQLEQQRAETLLQLRQEVADKQLQQIKDQAITAAAGQLGVADIFQGLSGQAASELTGLTNEITGFVAGVGGEFDNLGDVMQASLSRSTGAIGNAFITAAANVALGATAGPFGVFAAVGGLFSLVSGLLSGGGSGAAGAAPIEPQADILQAVRAEAAPITNQTTVNLTTGPIFSRDESRRAVGQLYREARQAGDLRSTDL